MLCLLLKKYFTQKHNFHYLLFTQITDFKDTKEQVRPLRSWSGLYNFCTIFYVFCSQLFCVNTTILESFNKKRLPSTVARN